MMGEEYIELIRTINELQRRVGQLERVERSPVTARVYNSANISVANAIYATLTFDSERNDTADMHSTSVNTERLTVAVGGLYIIGANAVFDVNGTGSRGIRIRLNGSDVIAEMFVDAVSATYATSVSVSTAYKLSANDYVEMRVFQSSGGALNVLALGNYSPEFWIAKI